MNIWASRRTRKSKIIPGQRNDFIPEQNSHVWTGSCTRTLTGIVALGCIPPWTNFSLQRGMHMPNYAPVRFISKYLISQRFIKSIKVWKGPQGSSSSKPLHKQVCQLLDQVLHHLFSGKIPFDINTICSFCYCKHWSHFFHSNWASSQIIKHKVVRN